MAFVAIATPLHYQDVSYEAQLREALEDVKKELSYRVDCVCEAHCGHHHGLRVSRSSQDAAWTLERRESRADAWRTRVVNAAISKTHPNERGSFVDVWRPFRSRIRTVTHAIAGGEFTF